MNGDKHGSFITQTAERLLTMSPDSIPRYILLKEFLGLEPGDRDFDEAQKAVFNHPFVTAIAKTQDRLGYWGSFHGDTEGILDKLLAYGLDKSHPALYEAREFMHSVLSGGISWRQPAEKQDNPRWWSDQFMPLVTAATLSKLDKADPFLDGEAALWAAFTETAFSNGIYDKDRENAAKEAHYGFKTKVWTPCCNYYPVTLLTSRKGLLTPRTEGLLFEHCYNKPEGMYYVYAGKPADNIAINHREFYGWVRVLTILSGFDAYEAVREEKREWLMGQRNGDGLWELDRKPYGSYLPLSDSWRKRKDKVIDSTIYILRLLHK